MTSTALARPGAVASPRVPSALADGSGPWPRYHRRGRAFAPASDSLLVPVRPVVHERAVGA
jgi:hypothetical protein